MWGLDDNAPTEKLTVRGNIAPSAGEAFSLGTQRQPWDSLYIRSSIHTKDRFDVKAAGKTLLVCG